MKIKIINIILALGIFSQTFGQNDDMFIPSELKQQTVITEPATLQKGFLKVSLDYSYSGLKKIFDEDTKNYFIPGSTIGRAAGFGLSAHFGITDIIQANLSIPYKTDYVNSSIILEDMVFNQTMQVDFQEKGNGLGDISAGIYAQLLKETDTRPSVTLRTTAILPTGRKDPSNYSSDSLSFDSPTGNGEFSLAVDLQLRKIVYPYSFTFYTGIDYGFGGNKTFNSNPNPLDFRSGNVYYVAGGFNFHLNDWICMTNDVYYTYIGPEQVDGIRSDETKWGLNYIPYIHFQIKQFRLVQGMMIPIKGKIISADPTYIFILQVTI